jgi:D-glucosaminate-6-phosphate ammonia-lyase
VRGISRRKLFENGALLALPGALRGRSAQAAGVPAAGGVKVGNRIFESIGVRPIINCKGTHTIVGGSLELPEVRAAKEAAAQHFVQLDELMEGIGKRLATLTGAEWGLVTSGCAAAITHATAACVAGANPDRHVRLPDLTGFDKDEVLIPSYSRNVYDAAVRAVGVRVVEVDTPEQLESALGPRTAMVYILAGDRSESGPLSLEVIARAANARKVPVLVDAAAEILTVPNVHLQRGATLVGYSGGKCLRGPQCAGLLLGRKDLVRAAWVHSAPHHGFGRAMKVGKEEAVGMLMAVETWFKRDHKAEWSRWVSWMEQIAKKVTSIEGVTANLRSEPGGLSNRSPSLSISWDPRQLPITGAEVYRILFDTDPRIVVEQGGGGGRWRNGGGEGSSTGIGIMAYMMQPGDAKVAANRIHEVLTAARKNPPRPAPQPPAADLSGYWEVDIEYIGSRSRHSFFVRQQGAELAGTHQGDFAGRDLLGGIDGNKVRLQSFYRANGDNVGYGFTGTLAQDQMSGELDLGEYLTARWSARRRQPRRRGQD